MDWQPIETAPKDGRGILAWFGKDVGVHQVAWTGYYDDLKMWCVDDGKHGPYALRGYNDPYPTHWMPLPPPPPEHN